MFFSFVLVGCNLFNPVDNTKDSELVAQQKEIYQLALNVGFTGTFEEWLESIKGEQGIPGDSIELSVSDGYIKWKNKTESTWYNLVSLVDFIGNNGQDGKEVVFQVSDGFIKWKYEGDTDWTNLVELSTLVGPKGDSGQDGKEAIFQVSEGFIKWQYEGDTEWTNLVELSTLIGPKGDAGKDGNEVVFQVFEGFIKWKYEGDTEWTNLVELSTLIGPKGDAGQDGKKVVFQVSDGFIKWQYESDTEWTNLVELSTLVGLKGDAGKDGKSAYEIYKEAHPDYVGDEQKWLNDLINGKLGNKEIFCILFDSNGGTVVSSQEVEDGKKAQKPEDPIKEGYTFDGWFINGNEKWVFGGYNVTEDITLVANWSANKYKVTFDAGLGLVEPNEFYYTYNQEAVLPIPVLVDNYFMGWYNDDELVEDGVWKITSDVTLRAYFIQEHYNVYYDLGYDGIEEIEQASYGQAYSPLIPIRKGYTFKGWYDEDSNLYEDGGEWRREKDLHLTALWEANVYLITLDLNGGSLEGELTYEVTFGEDFTLPIPTSTDGPFNGWYLDDLKMTDKHGTSLKPFKEVDSVTLIAIYFIEVSTADDLIKIKNDLDANYRLMSDIDISDMEWNPLGNDDFPFTGIFDGQGYIINGLTITIPHDFTGLFGYSSGTIKNIILDNVNIDFVGSINQDIYGASLVGYNAGIVEDITTLSGLVTFKVRSGVNGYIGGIVGYNNANKIFSNLQNNLDVTGDLTTATGGLIGYSSYVSTLIITDSYNTGTVSGVNHVGGLVGYASSNYSTITNSHNIGEVSGSSYTGGLVGYSLYNLTIISSYNNEDISGTDYIGGLIGCGEPFSITLIINYSYNSGNISGDMYVGGLAGNSTRTTITNSHNIGEVSGSCYVGGLVGYSRKTTITDSHNIGNVSGTGTSSHVGGLIGENYDSTLIIADSYNIGTVSGRCAGGLVGMTQGYSNTFTITSSYNTGLVNGAGTSFYVGGLVGYYYSFYGSSATITDSYNTGEVSGNDKVGGLVGYSSTTFTITNSYNTGEVSGNDGIGGLIGYSSTTVTITNSYNTGEVRGSSNVGGLVGLTSKTYIYYSVNLGEVRSTRSTSNIGSILGSIPETYDEEHIYHLGLVYVEDTKVVGLEYGTVVEEISIFTEDFFIETLGWVSENIVLISILTYLDSLKS